MKGKDADGSGSSSEPSSSKDESAAVTLRPRNREHTDLTSVRQDLAGFRSLKSHRAEFCKKIVTLRKELRRMKTKNGNKVGDLLEVLIQARSSIEVEVGHLERMTLQILMWTNYMRELLRQQKEDRTNGSSRNWRAVFSRIRRS